MKKKVIVLMILTSILFIPVLANNYLDGLVENNDDKTIGETWTGYTNYQDYVREQTVSFTRAANELYLDFPIEIQSIFPNAAYSPIWEGLFYSGSYAPYRSNTIKVIYTDSDGIEKELPFQISKDTKCFSLIGVPGETCTSDPGKYYVNYLRVIALKNITTSTDSVKIIYSTSFNGVSSPIPTTFYRFVYNQTNGKYTAYNGTSSAYPTRIQYSHTTDDVSVPELPIIYSRSNGDINYLQIGTCSNTNWDSFSLSYANDILKCPNTPLIGDFFTSIMGVTNPTVDFNVSVVLEIEKIGCNLGGIGYGNANMIEEIYPNFIRQKATVVPLYGSGTTSTYIYDPRVSASVGGAGGGGAVSVVDNALYRNTTLIDVDFPNTGAYGTAINPLYAGAGSVHAAYSVLGLINKGVMGFAPVTYVLNNRTSSMTKIYNSYGRSYTSGTAGGATVYGDSVINGTTTLEGNNRFEVFTIPYHSSVSISGSDSTASCAFTSGGYATYDVPLDIFTSEDFGGKILISAPWYSYSEPCTISSYTGSCESENPYEWINMSCLSNDDLGYVDNCGNEYPCTGCGGVCTDNGDSFMCGSTCVPKAVSTAQCEGENLKIVDPCGTSYVSCEFGCFNNQCLNTNIVNLNVFVNDPINQSLVGNAVINLTGVNTGYYNTLDSSYGGIYQLIPTFTIPASYEYYISASKSGYTTGCNNPTIGTSYGSYCVFTQPLIYSSDLTFDIYPTGTNANFTKATITTKFGTEPVENVTVFIYNNGIQISNGTTDNSGKVSFTWTNYTYTNVTVTASRTGYIDTTISVSLVPLCYSCNDYTIQLKSSPSFTVAGGFTGEYANSVYAQWWDFADIPMLISSSKAGKLVLSRVDVSVKGCEDWPFCQKKKLYWVNCLNMRNATKDLTGAEIYNATGRNLLADLAGATVDFISTATGTKSYINSDTVRKYVSQHSCTSIKTSSGTVANFNDAYGLAYQAIGCLLNFESEQVLIKFPVYSGSMSRVDPVLKAGYEIAKSIMEFFNPKSQDVFIEDIIFQCNNEEILTTIAEGTRFSVNYGSYNLPSVNYVSMVTDPAFKDMVRTGNPPFVLPTGQVTYDYISSFKGTGIAMDKFNPYMYIGAYRIDNGLTNLGNPKKIPNSITKNKLFGDIISDLRAGQFESSEVEYADLNSKIVPNERGKINLGTTFEIIAYLKADFYPDDGSGKQTTYYRVITHDTNIPINQLLSNWGIYILIFVIFVLPSILLVYLVIKRGK